MAANTGTKHLVGLVAAAFVSIAAAFGTVLVQSTHSIECPPASAEHVRASRAWNSET